MEETEGRQLLVFMHAHAPRAEGGLDGLALKHNLRRQTPYEWASGSRQPNLGTLRAWANALGVTRAEMVAAMDGTPEDTLSALSEAGIAALAGEIGSEVAAALVKRLPPQTDATPPAAGRSSAGEASPQASPRPIGQPGQRA